jgi:hypothetical protein
MSMSFNIAVTSEPQTERMCRVPAKSIGRPNEERKVKELLKKLEAMKAKKKPA